MILNSKLIKKIVDKNVRKYGLFCPKCVKGVVASSAARTRRNRWSLYLYPTKEILELKCSRCGTSYELNELIDLRRKFKKVKYV